MAIRDGLKAYLDRENPAYERLQNRADQAGSHKGTWGSFEKYEEKIVRQIVVVVQGRSRKLDGAHASG